jgi:hypothetical protein
MPPDHSKVTVNPTQWRSAITNGSSLGIDKRSTIGRRYRDLIAEFSRQIAGNDGSLNEAELILVRQAAAISIRVEALQIDIVNGIAVRDEDIVRLSNSLTRILWQLNHTHQQKSGLGRPPGRPLSKSASASIGEHFESRRKAAARKAESKS